MFQELMKKISKAVFPVAGLGTRFLPATKAIPKEMLPIIDDIDRMVESISKTNSERNGFGRWCMGFWLWIINVESRF